MQIFRLMPPNMALICFFLSGDTDTEKKYEKHSTENRPENFFGNYSCLFFYANSQGRDRIQIPFILPRPHFFSIAIKN